MEQEPHRRGDLYICESPEVMKDNFVLAERRSEGYFALFTGSIIDLSDSLFCKAIVDIRQGNGLDIYLILNPDDAKEYDQNN